jgi:hypothetical protein
MAMWKLDLRYQSNENEFFQTHELDGRRYQFRVTWNERDGASRLSVYQPDGTPLVLSRKIVLGVPLWRGEVDPRLPPGWLIAVDRSRSDVDPSREDLGERVPLIYFDADYLATGQ